MHLIYFLGRFHVLVLHLPITLILVVAVLEWLNRGHRRPDLDSALRILWPATALTALLTVFLGYMHFSEGGFVGPSAIAHRALGTSVAMVSILGWWVCARSARPLPATGTALIVALLILVTLTGHFGGNLTHGDTYLVEFAPEPLRKLVGLQSARAPVTDLKAADPFLDIVQPMFESRCSSCHNRDKQRGKLDLTNYSAAMRGGKDGAVIKPGDSKSSDLIRRVTLTPDEDAFMPKEGKTPLNAEQISVIKWWIDAGAKTGVKLAALQVPPEINKILISLLGARGAAAKSAVASNAMPVTGPPQKADAALVGGLTAAGFEARQVSMSDKRLIVSSAVPGTHLSAAQLSSLAAAPGDQIAELDLRQATLSDAEIKSLLSRFTDVTRLRLDRNKLTDESVAALQSLKKIEVLGLYGNAGITDKSVDALANMKSLKKLFLWQTGVTTIGIEKLRATRPDLYVEFGGDAPGDFNQANKEKASAAASG